jgi:hypothetical protein
MTERADITKFKDQLKEKLAKLDAVSEERAKIRARIAEVKARFEDKVKSKKQSS